MKFFRHIGLVLLAVTAGMTGAFASLEISGRAVSPSYTESVYDRVMHTQTIRCGYGPWPPFISKDVNTGEMTGIFYDYMEALGQALNLKVTWVEELGSGDISSALQSSRIDAMCASIWPSAARAREMDFIRPIYYSPMYAYARVGDERFDGNISRINDPSVTVISMDGEMAEQIALADFPDAKRVQLPQMSSVSEFFVNIAMKKADVTFANPAMFSVYESENPGAIRRVPTKTPIRLFGNTIAISPGQEKLRRMLDIATEELIANGKIEQILSRYTPDSDKFLRVSPSYEEGTDFDLKQ